MIFENYKNFLSKIKNNKYNFVFFRDFNPKKESQLILRHDIDLDIDLALEIAQIEFDLEIKSTYFFLLRSDSYNLISDKNLKKVLKIKDLGHEISIHFDLEIYNNVFEGLDKEIQIFQSYFDVNLDIISIHRPNKDFLEHPSNYFKISTTYDEIFTKKNISYYADSGGIFRYGSFIDSYDFQSNNNVQLLLHPIWWTIKSNDVNSIVKKLIKSRSHSLLNHYKSNIKTLK